jgi:transposase
LVYGHHLPSNNAPGGFSGLLMQRRFLMSHPPPASQPRFLGLDVHRQSITVAGVDKEQQIVLRPRRVALCEFANWAHANLTPTDAVVLEATSTAWTLYDQLQPLVASVTVAHPGKVQGIATSRVKTDPRDALHLARLLAAGLIPAVWVPPPAVRELRALLVQRQRLRRQGTRIRHQVQGLLQAHNLAAPSGAPFAQDKRLWWQSLPLSPVERLQVRQGWALLDQVDPLVGEIDAELQRLSTSTPWAAHVPWLIQLPGIGLVTAMTVLAAIGDINRFPTAKKLVGSSGLGASMHSSGDTNRTGAITKEGRRELRTVLVEAAWVAVEHSSHWREVFQRLAARIGKRKAMVAVARKLLVVIWHVLTGQVADRQAEVEAVARKLLKWGTEQGLWRAFGRSRGAFVRQQLTRLGLGAELTQIASGKRIICLPSG